MSSQFSKSKRRRIWERCNGHCAYCGVMVDLDTFHCDHMTARARGGSNDDSNLLPACPSCNVSKRDKTVSDFRLFVAAKVRTGETIFGRAQLKWLRDEGLLQAIGINDNHRFYCEMIGLEIAA